MRFDVSRHQGEARICVSDEGRGIEPEMLPHIFDLFVQGDQTLARSDGGLGIGLTLLRSLVELHDGRVEVTSGGADRGSVFTVLLPLARTALADAEKKAVARDFTVQSVVVVEDQEDARRMMEILLESKGLTVESAEDGLAGAELIERTMPDLALVDLGLPKLNGFDLARRIRHNSATAAVHMIALSGYGQESDVKAALDAGFDDHLTKPPDFDRLDELIAKAGKRRQ